MSDSNNTAGLSQSYIDKLTKELATAQNCYNEYHKAAQKAEDEYQRAKDWERCIKEFFDRITVTYSNVTSLSGYIDSFSAHTDKVCKAIGKANKATDILVVCVRCLSEENERLKQSLKELLEIIDCLNDPTLNPNESIMKCLMDFKAKIDAGIVANLAAIKELLKLVRCMLELRYMICKPGEAKVGLLKDLARLEDILKCADPHGEADSDGTCEEANEAYCPPDSSKCPDCPDDCGGSISPEPSDLNCDKDDMKPALCMDCGNSYKNQLKEDYNKAAKQACYAKCVWDHFKDLEQKAKSNLDATQAALDAASDAKNKCK